MNRTYLCIDLKTFYASVECVERGLNPFTTPLVVADPTRGNGTICLAVSPRMKELGVHNRCRIFEIPSTIKYIKAMPRISASNTATPAMRRIFLLLFFPPGSILSPFMWLLILY